MSKFIKNERTGKVIECPPYKCKCCGMGDIDEMHDICEFCAWEDDGLQNDRPDYTGGANRMSLNQYKKFWDENKEEILKHENRVFIAIKLAKEYYKKYFDKKS